MTMTRAEKIKRQITDIRDSGVVNMFDVRKVQKIAKGRGYWSLVNFIDYDKNGYVNFIMTGNELYLS